MSAKDGGESAQSWNEKSLSTLKDTIKSDCGLNHLHRICEREEHQIRGALCFFFFLLSSAKSNKSSAKSLQVLAALYRTRGLFELLVHNINTTDYWDCHCGNTNQSMNPLNKYL